MKRVCRATNDTDGVQYIPLKRRTNEVTTGDISTKHPIRLATTSANTFIVLPLRTLLNTVVPKTVIQTKITPVRNLQRLAPKPPDYSRQRNTFMQPPKRSSVFRSVGVQCDYKRERKVGMIFI